MSKRCRTCTTTKPLSEYYKNARDGHQSECKECCRERGRKRDWKQVYSKGQYARHLKRKYGLSWEQYQEMVALSCGTCYVCGDEPENKLYVDHCHTTNKVRGLLCMRCNYAEGMLRGNPTIVRRLADYLEETVK